MAWVTSYTYWAGADNRPGFPLSRPDFDEHGEVRPKSNPSPKLGGVRPSKNTIRTTARDRVRVEFGRGTYEHTQFSSARRASWAQAASQAGLEYYQYYQGAMMWRRHRGYSCVAVSPVSAYDFETGNSYWEEAAKLG
jgi:hypothetical protein